MAHGDGAAIASQFDLHRDSLPELSRAPVPLARLREGARLRAAESPVPPQARGWLAEAMRVLG